MKYLHYSVWAGPTDSIVVNLDKQARVLLLDGAAHTAYGQGRTFNYRGGWAKQTPVCFRPPYAGNWHVVVDLEGRSGTVHAGVRVVRAA